MFIVGAVSGVAAVRVLQFAAAVVELGSRRSRRLLVSKVRPFQCDA